MSAVELPSVARSPGISPDPQLMNVRLVFCPYYFAASQHFAFAKIHDIYLESAANKHCPLHIVHR